MAQYKLLDELGRGGMGVVLKALQMPLGREVAIKVLDLEPGANPEFEKRFKKEIAASIKLAHPGVIKILDAGEKDGRFYYVMEYLADAVPLDRLIKKEGRQTPSRAVGLLLQLLEALDYCHGQEIIHRDIKPANIMVAPGERLVLMDFGLAKDLTSRTVLTAEGKLVGTPLYLAPEIILGQQYGAQSDLWAAGLVLYEMLAGKRPFSAGNVKQVAYQIINTDPTPLSQFNADLPPGLEALLMRFLVKDPKHRMPSAREAIRAIRQWQNEGAKTSGRATATIRRPSRRTLKVSLGRRVRLVRALPALIVGAIAIMLVLLATLSLRDPAISTSSSPTALTGLEWASSGTQVFASFSTDRPAVFALQVEPGGGGAPWTTLEGTAGNAHRLVVTGLEPDRRYRARVLDQAGKVVATRALSTLSLTALADRLIESLRAARVGSLAREIPALVAGALKIRPRSEDLEATWAALRREWEEKIGQAFEQARLDTLAGEFTPHRDQVFTSPEVPVDTRVRLYESIQALRDLEVGAELLRIRMPTLSVSLSSPEYSQVAGPRPGKLAGVAFRFETDPTLLVNEGATTEPLTVRVLPSAIGQLSSLGDPSNPDQFMIDDASHAFFTATEPVALPGARVPRLELRASLDPFEPATGVRVLCSTAADPRPPRAWRLVAHLRPADRGRAVVYHPIPSDLLMERPLFLRFELAFCHALPVVQFNAEQQCRLHWIVLGYEATTRGGREAGR